MRSIQVGTSTPAQSILATFAIPTDILPEMKRKKIEGFKNFRATTKLHFKASTTAFISGQVCIFYYAHNEFNTGTYCSHSGSDTSPGFITGQNVTSLTSATGCPSVILDLASGEPVEVDVPYMAPISHWDMTAVDPSSPAERILPVNFMLVVCAYSDIWVDAPFSIQVMVSLHDVDLSFPTFPTRTLLGTQSVKLDKLLKLGVDPSEARKFLQEENKQEVKNDISRHNDQEYELQGLISTVANTANTVLHATDPITKHIPILSSVSGVAKKLLPPIADVASAMGYSKELKNSEPCDVQMRVAKYAQNIDGEDASRCFALSSHNQVHEDSGDISSVEDEMSFANIFKRFEYIGFTKWYRTNPAGTALAKILVTPLVCDQVYNVKPIKAPSNASFMPPGDLVVPTHLAYLGHMFWMWRGSLIYKIRFVKTCFHVGRVRIMWLPGDQDNAYDPAVTYASNNPEASFFMQKIVDLRDTNEVEFEVPFASVRPFNYCEGVKLGENTYPNYISNGTLLVQSLTDLSAPDTVCPYITMIVEIKAGEDFEYANYKGNPWYLPVSFESSRSTAVARFISSSATDALGPLAAQTYGGIIPEGASVEPATHVIIDNATLPVTTSGTMNVQVLNSSIPITTTGSLPVGITSSTPLPIAGPVPVTFNSTMNVNVENSLLDVNAHVQGTVPIDVGTLSNPMPVKLMVPSASSWSSGPPSVSTTDVVYQEVSIEYPLTTCVVGPDNGTTHETPTVETSFGLRRRGSDDTGTMQSFLQTSRLVDCFHENAFGRSVIAVGAHSGPLVDDTVEQQMFHIDHQQETYEMQSGITVDDQNEINTSRIIREPHLNTNLQTTGEVISSLRALTNVFSLNVTIDNNIANASGHQWRPNGFTYHPQLFKPLYGYSLCTDAFSDGSSQGMNLSPDRTSSVSTHTPDLLDALSIMYGFWKGSVRSKVIAIGGGPSTCEVFMRPSQTCSSEHLAPFEASNAFPAVRTILASGNTFGGFGNMNVGVNPSSFEVFIGNDVESRCIELQHPYYQPLLMTRLAERSSSFGSVLYNAEEDRWYMPSNAYSYVYEEANYASAKLTRRNRLKVFRAAGNDFSFHFLQGIPPIARSKYSQYGGASPDNPVSPSNLGT